MEAIISVVTVLALVFFFILNFHVIRTRKGFEVITKDQMDFRNIYVDVRTWGFKDYVTRSPRIRNHLIYKKPAARLSKYFKQGNGKTSANSKRRKAEKTVHHKIKA